MRRSVGVLHQTLKTWPSDLGGRDTIPRAGFRGAKAVGERMQARQSTNGPPDCQPETAEKYEVARNGASRRPSPPGDRPSDWSGKRDSNPRPSAWKADALPLSYSRSSRCARRDWWRGEDSNLRRLRRQIYSLLPLTAREPLQGVNADPGMLELAKGLEPPTPSLQVRSSTD